MNRGGSSTLLTQLRRSPGKTAFLGFCFLIASWTWVGILFGGEHRENAPAAPLGTAPQGAPQAPAPGFGTSTAPAIADFGTAMNRILTWRGPLGLYLERSAEFSIAVPEIADSAEVPPPAPVAETQTLPKLTGTVLLGTRSFAFLDGEKHQVGDRVGRYEIRAIHPREVVLASGDQTLVVRITPKLDL